MEFYHTSQTQQLAPLIVFSLHETDAAKHLKLHLEKSDIANCVWDNSILKNRLLSAKYILQFCSEQTARERLNRGPKAEGAHAANSPFSTQSDLFPNGILSENWFQKYTEEVPFAFIQTHILGDDPIKDEELGLLLAEKRQEYADLGVKYVAILLSDEDPIADQDRVDKLRLVSGLPRLTGIFYLNSDRETLERDCGILASSLFNNLKAPAADFYTAVLARIKQRHKKYYNMPSFANVDTKVSLSPKMLEVRNLIKQAIMHQLIHPHNVESSFAILESSYELLIEIIADHEDVFFSDSLSSHDKRLYDQFRQLLDVIAIHLIRGYFSTEEPTAALRKHEAHIANVLSLCKSQPDSANSAWVSVQYQWLGELMQMVPPSVLSDLTLDHQVKQKSYQNSLAYFGGSTFHDTFNSMIITQSFLIYLRAYNKLAAAKKNDSHLDYLKLLGEEKSAQQHRLLLLEKARKALEDSTNQGATHLLLIGLQEYLDWLTAEECYFNGQHDKAEERYTAILHNSAKLAKGARQVLGQRLLLIYKKAEKPDKAFKTLVEIASLTQSQQMNHIAQGSIEKSLELTYDGSLDFFSVQVHLFNETFNQEFFAFDTVITQIDIKPLFKIVQLQRLIKNSEVKLHIDSIEVNYEGRSVVIKHQATGSDIDRISLTDLSIYHADFSDLETGKTIQILEEVNKPGRYKVESLHIHSSLLAKADGNAITLKKGELHNFLKVNEAVQSFTAMIQNEDGTFRKQIVRNVPQQAVECTVLPYKPQVNVELSSSPSSVIMGERFDIPLKISHKKSPHQKVAFTSLSIQIKSKILEGEQELDYLVPQTNWKDLKDDENLNILGLFEASSGSSDSVLQVGIRRPPSNQTKQNIKLAIELQLIVGETNKSISVYDPMTLDIPVLPLPFQARIEVSPRYRADSSLDMKNPFILSSDASPERNFSMPLPSRVWAAEARILDVYKLVELTSLIIKSCTFTLRSKNDEVEVNTLEETEQNQLTSSQQFVVNSRHRFSHRLVAFVASAVYTWARGENGAENEFETDEFEFNLPLQDPRVLLFSAETKDLKTTLKYVIENPTSRIFTFTTTMNTEESALRGVNWNFDDKANIVPLKQGAFPVLPFSRHEMVFTGSITTEDTTGPIELPKLQVYDLNYKVSLPPLPVAKNVFAKEDSLYLSS